ncbi:phage head closure protein [Martelella limonii]|uniref:phage head closure protein n=1 Tax=Martelella limonii TaxID=1647649 RepID=UPI00157FF94C|nr:phage head closure protein [Martelella limonii]
MRAGNLDRTITIQRYTSTVDEFGAPVFIWQDIATLRGQKVESSTEEFIRDFGASDEAVIVFRTRYIDGITNADRVEYGSGTYFNIKGLKEIGRRNGLEIRCVRLS